MLLVLRFLPRMEIFIGYQVTDCSSPLDSGVTWTSVGNGLQAIPPIELADGRIVSSTATNLMASSDGGLTWTAIGAALPFAPQRVIYSATRQAFFISKWDCGNVVLSDAIAKLDYAVVTPTPTPTPIHATHGDNFGKSGQHDLRQSLDRDLVLDQRNLMHRVGRVDGDEGDQRYPYGIADKHYDLHADLHREWRYVRSGQYDGSGECRPAPVSGVCGSANGTTASSKPSTNLCSAGTASSVAGSGPWTWSCGGSNGGTTASCSASLTAQTPTPTCRRGAGQRRVRIGERHDGIV